MEVPMWTIDYQEIPEPGSPDTAGALVFPRELLEEHGARVLDPAAVSLGPGEPVPGSTVYHADMLLVPTQFLAEPALRDWFARALDELGLTATPPRDVGDSNEEFTDWRAVVLKVARGVVEVDAWPVLQHLRTRLPQPTDEQASAEERILRYGRQITLNHVMLGSAFTGMAQLGGEPVTDGHGLPGDHQATTGFGYATRAPVQVVRPKPEPDPNYQGRRPVVALIDTGSAHHDWFPWTEKWTANDQFLVSTAAQEKILAGTPVNDARRRPVPVIRDHVDGPVSGRPLLGLVNAQAGHATFEAGLIHQLAPDARILNLRAMFPSGLASEHAVRIALQYVLDLVKAAQRDPNQGLFVDVVSLSCGYFSENDEDRRYTQAMENLVDELRRRGVMVVAAAGNFAASRAFYPSGLAGAPDEEFRAYERAPIFGVGASNPNGSIAIFSNAGKAIKYHAPGAMLISTFPDTIRGSTGPRVELTFKAGTREWTRASFDADDFNSGFALWSGTSFAAPVLAGRVLAHLIRDHQATLADVGLTETLKRGKAVVRKLQT
ncbi:peptidase S8 [Acrocarpospora corrugata]|uniref:Peptidase S8 n=1 Tax=Acrocarpospora corrugata TaxID=35763 RepID=A0A5M3VWX4_9ACTN|nr:S8 family serine peptidase [Acrocarpospora corrugata]GES00192.1 peptidase S8 [Acrocarpospora corrugata]